MPEPYYVPLTDDMLSTRDSGALTPEEELISREDGEPPETTQSPDRMLACHRALQLLPTTEAECVRLVELQGLSQITAASRLACTQPTVSYRLSRAHKRLAWIFGPMRLFTATDVRRELRAKLPESDVRILATLWATTSESETARRLRKTQPSVSRAFRRALDILASEPTLQRFYAGFSALAERGLGLLAR